MNLFRLSLFAYVVLLCLAVPALAQTAVTKEQANAYYVNCKSKPDPRMKPESQDAFCSCTAVTMMKTLSVEDVNAMAGNDQTARNALNTMLLDVYAPCMSYPVEDLVTAQCLNDPRISQIGSATPAQDICGCMAARTASWFVKDGRGLMAELLKQNPNITDPLTPVMESKPFQKQSYESMIACLNGG